MCTVEDREGFVCSDFLNGSHNLSAFEEVTRLDCRNRKHEHHLHKFINLCELKCSVISNGTILPDSLKVLEVAAIDAEVKLPNLTELRFRMPRSGQIGGKVVLPDSLQVLETLDLSLIHI
jgi:hypothetical protein